MTVSPNNYEADRSGIMQIAEVEAQGVQINCPYSTFTDEDGFFDSEIIDYTPGLPQAMHLGVLAHMVKVFDPTDEKMLNVNADVAPESFLLALDFDKTAFKEIAIANSPP